LAVQKYGFVSHQCGKNLSFSVPVIIPDEVSFTAVPNAHQTGKQGFHQGLLLFVGKE
jgi:hypothetical protein